jgi:hypothetical protein
MARRFTVTVGLSKPSFNSNRGQLEQPDEVQYPKWKSGGSIGISALIHATGVGKDAPIKSSER